MRKVADLYLKVTEHSMRVFVRFFRFCTFFALNHFCEEIFIGLNVCMVLDSVCFVV